MSGKVIRHNNEDILVELLKQLKDVLDRHGIEFRIECGTLLGAVRHGMFIPWDEDDIDLVVWDDAFSDDQKLSVAKQLYNRGIRAMIYPEKMRLIRGVALADIYIYQRRGDTAIHLLPPTRLVDRWLRQLRCLLTAPHYYGIQKTGPIMSRLRTSLVVSIARLVPAILRGWIVRMVALIYQKTSQANLRWEVPTRYFTDLATIQFYGMEFRAPAKLEEYLAYRYGKDWRTPDKNYVTLRDDGALRRNDGVRWKKKL